MVHGSRLWDIQLRNLSVVEGYIVQQRYKNSRKQNTVFHLKEIAPLPPSHADKGGRSKNGTEVIGQLKSTRGSRLLVMFRMNEKLPAVVRYLLQGTRLYVLYM